MYKFFLFLRKILFVLLFFAIEGFALRYYAGSSSYNQAKMINISNFLVGDIHAGLSRVKGYFSLRKENERLTSEVAELREALQYYSQIDTLYGWTPDREQSLPYQYGAARVVNNSISRSENYITIDKGLRDGVEPEMALLSNGAIIGYILNCSERFSVAISILNTKFRTSGRIQGEDFTGSIFWDGRRSDEVIFSEVPKYADMAVGDTIVTSDYSSFFPPNLRIGTVQSVELINGTYYDARIRLFANMGALNQVVVVDYVDREEKLQLERETIDNQTP